MALKSICYETASDDEIVAACHHPLRDCIFHRRDTANTVVRISDVAVVKFGTLVYEEEARNLDGAHALVDQKLVRVPRVYRFITRDFSEGGPHFSKQGYLVMEYIQGRIPEESEYPDVTRNLALALKHMHTIRGPSAGPLGGGVSRGLYWEEDYPRFYSTDDFNAWLRTRQVPRNDWPVPLHFQTEDLVLCHLDIAPRNVLLLKDGRICLVDWGSAGFYPRTLEHMMLKTFAGGDAGFNELLLEALGALPADEEATMYLLAKIYNNNQQYYLYATVTHTHMEKFDVLLVSPLNAPTGTNGSPCLALGLLRPVPPPQPPTPS